jgi:hypothetical protein
MLQRIIASAMGAGLIAIAMACSPVLAQEQSTVHPLRPSPNALPAIQAPAVVAQDNSCASVCQTQHDQCRVQTKGSPACDAARQRCLQACIAGKKK